MIGFLNNPAFVLPQNPTEFSQLPSGGNRAARRSRKGVYGKRIIRTVRLGDRILELHATKGWRSYRAPDASAPLGMRSA